MTIFGFPFSDIIATFAFFISVGTLYLQYRKDKKDVDPLFSPTHGWNNRNRTIKIENKGQGPAIITKIVLNFESGRKAELKPYSPDDNDPINLLSDASGFSISHSFNDNYILTSGETFTLLSLSFDPQHGDTGYSEITNGLKKINIEITYKTTYSNKEYTYDLPASHTCDLDVLAY